MVGSLTREFGRTHISLSAIVAVGRDIVRGIAVAPTPALEMDYGLIGSITETLGIENTRRGTVETHGSGSRDVVKVSLEISIGLLPRIYNIYWVSCTRGNPTCIRSSSNLGEPTLTPTCTPRVLN